MKLFLPVAVALLACVAQAQEVTAAGDTPVAPATPAVAAAKPEAETTATEPAAWKEEDLAELMKGEWWGRMTPLLPEMEEAKTPAASLPNPDEDAPPVDLIPEDFENVHEYFLPAYISKGSGLIDPQKLLTEVESQDVLALIDRIKEVYKVNLFVSIFAQGQKVPASVNAPAVSRQIFETGKRNLLLHYHVGDIKNVQVALDPDLSARLGDTGRRDLLYRVKQDAAVYTYPQDELMAAMISLVERSRVDLAAVPEPVAPDSLAPERAYVPKVGLDIDKPQETKDEAVKKLFKEWGKKAQAHLELIATLAALLLTLPIVWWIWRRHRVVRLLPSEPDRRLSAPNGASQSRPVNYRTQERYKQD